MTRLESVLMWGVLARFSNPSEAFVWIREPDQIADEFFALGFEVGRQVLARAAEYLPRYRWQPQLPGEWFQSTLYDVIRVDRSPLPRGEDKVVGSSETT